MDCREFDEQVVRLEGIEDISSAFVRVRLNRVADSDLSVFEFDYDLTMMIFLINADEQILARYGGRDAKGPDTRQSLAGLNYTMRYALDLHRRDVDLPPRPARSSFARQFMDSNSGSRRGCIHCHDVKEVLNQQQARLGVPNDVLAWRYPLPENVGIRLEVDRGNVVRNVLPGTAAADIGLQTGDILESLGKSRIGSFADAQYALDQAPIAGTLPIVWQRDDQRMKKQLRLTKGWRKTNILWRPSMYKMIASPRLFGDDLELAEAYYRLGIAESSISRSIWVPETEYFLETAIRIAPQSSHARNAYTFLEQFVLARYTGSAGTSLPDDVWDRLMELRGLVEDS